MTKNRFLEFTKIMMLSIMASMILFTACEKEEETTEPVANFTYTISESNSLEVTFTNTSTDATVYAWSFGDEAGTSTEASPVYTYTVAGTFTVELVASDADGNSNIKTAEVTLVAPEVNESELLVTYLEETAAINTFPMMIKSSDVYTNLTAGADQYIIDIRAAADYALGHIEGAHNVPSADVLTHYEENGLESKELVVLVCYSGQSAAWVNGLMHTMGYTNCKDMKWGMSSWNATTSGSWVNNIGNGFATQLVTDVTEKAAEGDLPVLTTEETTAEDILRARVNAVFAEGFGAAATTGASIFDTPENYYIVNYWSETDYSWGHVPGAIQYSPKADLTSDTYLKTLATDKPVAVYCYTGQTSAHVAAYLRVLGYDAKSVKFGVNAMSWDAMPGTRFVEETEVHDYPLSVD